MKKSCTICGCSYETYTFKAGHICEDCIHYLKADFQADSQVRTKHKHK